MLMDPFTMGLAALGFLLDQDDKDTQARHQREMDIQRAKTERNIQYANTVINALATFGGMYMEHRRQNQGQQQYEIRDNERQLPLPPPPPGLNTANLIVDYKTIFLDKQNNIMSAQVMDRNYGQIHSYAYFLQKINDKVQNILESIDGGQWQNVGIVDFNRMSLEDIGSQESGGAIFGEIFKTVIMNQSKQSLPAPPPPQTQITSPKSQNKQQNINHTQPQFEPTMPDELTYEEFMGEMTREWHTLYGNIGSLYFANMSDKGNEKIVSAMKNYAPEAMDELIICVFDDTFFGGGDDGFLITDEALYFHNALEDNNYRIPLKDIISMRNEYANRSIFLNCTNGSVILKLGLLDKNKQSFDEVIQMINDIKDVMLGN